MKGLYTSTFPYCFRFRVFIMIAFVSLLIPGCVGIKGLFESESPYRTPTYKRTLDKWSREARIHRGFEVVLIAHATLKSKEYRRAYAQEYAMARRLTTHERDKFVEDQLHAASLGYEFLMASFVPEKAWDDFDQPGSMWRLLLVNDKNQRLEPSEVRRVEGQDPVLSHFFPYITPHKSTFIVRFPRDDAQRESPFGVGTPKGLTFIIASVLGTAEMDWKLEDSPQRAAGDSWP